ncbi:22774_t:CDS:2 [Entrophospora sp. SA101]|nr:22774_t:CDS:2 [Entrophospora sp. SA101]
MSTDQQKKQTMQYLQKTIAERWDKLYIDQARKRNSAFMPSPALIDLVEVKKFELPEGKGLVPGCGQGYDVFYLANEKRHITGLDLSETVIDQAIQLQKNKAIDSSIATFIAGDFFKLSPTEKFQLVYDYTFLCALPPTLRESWASKMAELISPGGVLIALIFPIWSASDHEGGPPYALNLEIYQELLENDFTKEYFDPDCPSYEHRKGYEAMS